MEHPGRVIADLYRLEEQLGRGAMGRIWRAEHLRLRSKLAIKFLDASVAAHPEALDRFVREAQSAAAVRSAHVVQIFDCGVDDGVPYISMELLEGESLDRRLAARGALSARELNELFSGVAQAVDTAHASGVIHRDLKPGNIFITRERDVELAKVLDFGIAKLMNHAAVAAGPAGTGTGVMLGTPYYMSPEQVRGSRDLDQRTDLWSLAVIAFECLTGELPFRGESVGDIVVQICTVAPALPSALAEVPAGFDEWFAKGTQKDPSGRFASAREMADALGDILARSPAAGARAAGAPSEPVRAPAPLPPSQSTAPMTAPIPSASGRAISAQRARARRGTVAIATALALACGVCAVVLWAAAPRRVSSGLEPVSPPPASSSRVPLVEVRAPATRDGIHPSGAVIEAAAAAFSSPAPEASQVAPVAVERPLEPVRVEGAALAPEPPLAPAGARRSSMRPRAVKQAVRAGRQRATKKSKRRSPATPAPAPESHSEPDPFSDRR